MPLPAINAHIYAYPADAGPGPNHELTDGVRIPTLKCPSISQSKFPLSFEDVAERLQKIERVYFEFDGSFVWAGSDSEQVWQLYGMLYDCAGALQRVELKGSCPLKVWNRLMQVFGDEGQRLVAHLLDYHCFVDTRALRTWWPDSKNSSK